jgi:hypothetical protein
MANASLENGNLTLNKLIINNSLYSDASGYIPAEIAFTSSKNSITVNDLTLDNLTINDNFSSSGITNISGLFFGTIAGPVACVGNASTLFQRTYPFPSSTSTQIITTVNSISTVSGTIFATGVVIAPFSPTSTIIEFNYYNPTSSTITVNTASVIIFNPTGNGGVQNIV